MIHASKKCQVALVLLSAAIFFASCAGGPATKTAEKKQQASPEELLYRAAERANAEEVNVLLAAGANPNFSLNGKTTLHAAAGWDSPPNALVVKALLAAGADPAAMNDKGQTPLEYHLSRAKPRADLYPAVDNATILEFNMNALYAAKPLRKNPFGANGTSEIVAAVGILSQGVYGEFAGANLLPTEGPALEAALFAALNGDNECACVDLLRRAYAAGVKIPQATLDGLLATATGRVQAVAVLDLLSRGAKPSQAADGSDAIAKFATSMNETTTFTRRVFTYECVRNLVASGLRPFSPDGPAAMYRRVRDDFAQSSHEVNAVYQRLAIESTRLYVSSGASPNGLVKGNFYDTPLIHAAFGDYLQNPFIHDTPEQYAAIRALIMAIVEAKGVDLEAPYLYDESNGMNWKGCTPLEYAFAQADKRAPDAIKILLKAGAATKKLIESEEIARRVGAWGDVERAKQLYSMGMPVTGAATDAMILSALPVINNRRGNMKACKELINFIEAKRGNPPPF